VSNQRQFTVRKFLPPAEAWVVLVAMAILGFFLAPCCHSTIWSGKSWTAWDSAIANRILAGTPLYTDGLRVPLDPLAIMEMTWLGGPSRWLTESVANFLTDCASVLLVYAGLRRLRLCPTSAALAAFLALPVRAAWMKIALYDEMALFFTACSFLVATSLHRRWADNRAAPTGYVVALAACTVLGILSKYSIGLGLFAGTGLFLTLASPGRDRWRHALVYVCSLPVFLALACALFSPWMSVGGFLSDVVATGSETKGGASLMVALVGCIARNSLYGLAIVGLFALAAGGLFEKSPAAADGQAPAPPGPLPEPVAVQWPVLGAAVAGGSLAFLIACFQPELRSISGGDTLVSCLASGRRFMDVLVVGFFTALASLVYSATAWWRGSRGSGEAPDRGPALTGWFPLLLAPTFLMFCLSGGRWILSEPEPISWLFRILPVSDPLDLMWIFGFTVLFSSVTTAAARRSSPYWARWIVIGLAAASGFAAWSRLEERAGVARDCTQAWPEVAFLRGVRMQPGNGMRDVIRAVRKLAPDKADRVLMLPEDPETVALFERPRPDVRGGIIFFDMYRDTFVDGDVAELEAHPPEVIVLGPSGNLGWGLFMFGPAHDSRGASRLMRRIESELLPTRYRLAETIPLSARDPSNTMAIYQLRTNSE